MSARPGSMARTVDPQTMEGVRRPMGKIRPDAAELPRPTATKWGAKKAMSRPDNSTTLSTVTAPPVDTRVQREGEVGARRPIGDQRPRANGRARAPRGPSGAPTAAIV
eukprot:7311125-Alexandrium_andersonii.AAC.1